MLRFGLEEIELSRGTAPLCADCWLWSLVHLGLVKERCCPQCWDIATTLFTRFLLPPEIPGQVKFTEGTTIFSTTPRSRLGLSKVAFLSGTKFMISFTVPHGTLSSYSAKKV